MPVRKLLLEVESTKRHAQLAGEGNTLSVESAAVVTGLVAGSFGSNGDGVFFGVTASFCGATGLTAVAAPDGLGLALATSFAFSSGLSAW